MNIMNQMHLVSFFQKLYRTESEETNLEELIVQIRSGRWKREVSAYRTALSAHTPDEANSLKKRLPGFTPSGLFRGGHKAEQLAHYNQVVSLDFDSVADLPSLVDRLSRIPFTLAFFISPGGSGLKVFVEVDTPPRQHKEAFLSVALHYERAAGLLSDHKCKDICRCCYLSDDPGAWYNPEAQTFAVTSLSPVQLFVHDWLARNPAREGNRNDTAYRLGCAANRKGFSRDEVAAFCLPLMEVPGFSSDEIGQTLRSAYQGNTIEFGVNEGRCGQLRTIAAPAVFVSAKAPEEPVEESDEEGEILRSQTPFLPPDLTDGLSPLLTEAIGFYTDRRERDMAFLAACTVLSACLPGVWGIYNRKRVYPHLFTVEVAPAANGKGCVTDMRRLADRYASLIEIETAREEQAYLQELEEWEVKKAHAHAQKQAVQVADAPRRVSTHYFYLPSQITKAKLLIHLADNGEKGGLLIDSEMDTLISAGKQEFGQFDDLLRKAFHHEPVASSRKTNNELIRVECPRMALLLAGTPGQFYRLVPHVENGLMSRLLLYTCRSEAIWQDVSPRGNQGDFETVMASLSEKVMETALILRKQRLQVKLTDRQWEQLNEHFSRLLREADLFGHEEFLSVVKRYGLMTFRLCMLFTALDAAHLGYSTDVQYCSDAHFRAALAIIETCLEHSRLLMTQLNGMTDVPELSCPTKAHRFQEILPEQFTITEAYLLGKPLGLNERSVRRALLKLQPLYIIKISRGAYRKVSPVKDKKTAECPFVPKCP